MAESKRRGRRRLTRAQAPEDTAAVGSRDEILAVATEEFAEHGLSGSRVDEIAERTSTSKRMIYYHFGSKEGLYRAVLEKAYSDIRSLDSQLNVRELPPRDAIRRIVEITFDYDDTHPSFVSLVSIENVHKARHVARLPAIRKRNAAILETLEEILRRGRAIGEFRADVNALDLHMLISALCYFRVSNRHTFGAIFNCSLSEPTRRKWHRQLIADAIDRLLQRRAES